MNSLTEQVAKLDHVDIFAQAGEGFSDAAYADEMMKEILAANHSKRLEPDGKGSAQV